MTYWAEDGARARGCERNCIALTRSLGRGLLLHRSCLGAASNVVTNYWHNSWAIDGNEGMKTVYL